MVTEKEKKYFDQNVKSIAFILMQSIDLYCDIYYHTACDASLEGLKELVNYQVERSWNNRPDKNEPLDQS